MKSAMKKFYLLSKYANYYTWDEKQNVPYNQITFIPQKKFHNKQN
jgi:hypothetical protein